MNKILPMVLVIAALVIALQSLDRPASNVFNGNVIIKLDTADLGRPHALTAAGATVVAGVKAQTLTCPRPIPAGARTFAIVNTGQISNTPGVYYDD